MELTSATTAATLAIESQSVLLPILILIPLLGAILLAFVPKEQETVHRGIGFAFALIAFFASLPLLSSFDASTQAFQAGFDFSIPWIESIGASFTLQLDGISLWIVLLTTFLTPVILFAAKTAVDQRVREFVIAMLVLETAMLGALFATDLLLFYLF